MLKEKIFILTFFIRWHSFPKKKMNWETNRLTGYSTQYKISYNISYKKIVLTCSSWLMHRFNF